jgi:hypothetical protein
MKCNFLYSNNILLNIVNIVCVRYAMNTFRNIQTVSENNKLKEESEPSIS